MLRLIHVPLTALSAAALLTAPFARADDAFPSKDTIKAARLLDDVRVPEKTRSFLRNKMKHHSEEMRELVMAVVLLDHQRSRSLAWAIANQPRLDRSVLQQQGVVLDPSFFTLQDQLKANAKTLAEATADKDPGSLTASLSQVLNTCATCHALFRTPNTPDAGVR